MNPEEDELSLGSAIDHLSSKKSVISNQAQAAKSQIEEEPISVVKPKKFQKQVFVIKEFNESVKLLGSIFDKSGFDRLVLFLTQPQKVIIMNFLIGMVWGLGFCLSVIFMAIIVLYFVNVNYPSQSISAIVQLFG